MDYIKIPLYLSGPNATVDRTDSVTIGTAGSYGVHAFEVERGRNWDNLSIKATFYQKPDNGENTTTPSDEVIQISVVETGDGLIPIPNELFETETDEVGSTQPQTWVTFSGYDGENLKMNSLRLMLEISDTGPTYTTAFTPTPDIEEQLINAVKEIRDAACECATQAGEYSFEAAKSATAAKASEQNAYNSEINAASSELAAELSAQAAEASELNAKQSETIVDGLVQKAENLYEEGASKIEAVFEDSKEEVENIFNEGATKVETIFNEGATKIQELTNSAKDSSDKAEEYAKQAKESADAAKASQDAALVSETNAKTSETNASKSASDAATSATNAGQSETNALGYANRASAQATAAAESQRDAASSRDAAATSANSARTYMLDAKNYRDDAQTAAESTIGYATQASGSASAAQASASKAATSEKNAHSSEVNAASSATLSDRRATEAATSASNAATSAQDAADSLADMEDLVAHTPQINPENELWQTWNAEEGQYEDTGVLARGQGVAKGGQPGQILVKKSVANYDTEWVDKEDAHTYSIEKQMIADEGFLSTYYLTKDGTQVGTKINIPKDYLVNEASLKEVTETDVPYSGAVIGDLYIDFIVNAKNDDSSDSHIYLPVNQLVDVYTGGNGIDINSSNTISVVIDSNSANGLSVDNTGIKLSLATEANAGAMSANDKIALKNAENDIDAIEGDITSIKDGSAPLPYIRNNAGSFTGGLSGDSLTLSGNANVSTAPTEDAHLTNKKYVDEKVASVDVSEQIAPLEERITQAENDIDAIPIVSGSDVNGSIKINNVESTVYTHPTHTAYGKKLYKIQSDDKGHIISADEVTKSDITILGIPAQDTTYTDATTTKSGLMSATDKIALNTAVEDIVDIKEDYVSNGVNNVAKGNPAICNNSVEYGLQGMRVYGKSTQVTTTGAQKIQFPLWNEAVIVNGVTLTPTDDGFKVSGTATSTADFVSQNSFYLENNDYIMSTTGVRNNEIDRMCVYADSGLLFCDIIDSNNVSDVSPIPDGTYYILYRVVAGQTVNKEYGSIMLNAGSTALPFEPYTGGKPSPSPEYLQEITNAGDTGSIGTAITGKNLLTGLRYYGNYNSGRPYIVNENEFSFPYAPKREELGVCQIAPVREGVTYTFSVTNPNTNANLLLGLYKTFEDAKNFNNCITKKENGLKQSITPSENGILVCLIAGIWTNGSTTTHECTESELLQLEIGTNATAYEAPQSQNLSFDTPNGLPGIPVDSGGNFTDSTGQQWICNYRDWARGVDVKWIDKTVVDGSNVKFTLGVNSGDEINTFWNLPQHSAPNGICVASSFWNPYFSNDTFSLNENYDFIWTTLEEMTPYGFNSADELNAFCVEKNSEGNPLTIMYALVDPVETPIPADELAAYRALHAYDGTTVISSTDSLAEIEFNYTTSNQTNLPYIKNKGDSVSGTYDFTLAELNVAEPIEDSNPVTKGYLDEKIEGIETGLGITYTEGNGIDISENNAISVKVDSTNSNGIEVAEQGIKLNLATSSTSGAMSGADKAKLDASSTTEQMNQAISTAVSNATNPINSSISSINDSISKLTNGTTELPYIKDTGDTITGSYDFTGATVKVAEPIEDINVASKKYVDDSIEAIDVSSQITPLTERITAVEGEVDTLQSDIGAAETNITNITNGTTELPYIKDSGDSVSGNYSFNGTVTDTASRTSNLQIANLNTNPDQWTDAEYANVKYNSTDKRVDFSLMTNSGLTANGVKVSGAEPEGNSDFTTKNYVDTAVSGAKSEATNAINVAKTELEGDIGAVQQTVTEHEGSIDTLAQTVNNITNGTTELPYIKNTGDTVDGDYTFNGKVNVNQPTENSNVANKEYVDNTIENIKNGSTELPYVKKSGDTITGLLTLEQGMKNVNTFDPAYVTNLSSNALSFKHNSIVKMLSLQGNELKFSDSTAQNLIPIEVGTPVENNDAATKGYVDENTSPLYTKSSFGVSVMGISMGDENYGVFTDNVKTESSLYGLTLYGDSSQEHYNGDNLLNPDNITENVGYSDSGTAETKQGVFSIKFVFEEGKDYEFNVVDGSNFKNYLSQLNIFYYTAGQSFVEKVTGSLSSVSAQLINSKTNSANSGCVYIELIPKEDFTLTKEFITNNFTIFPRNKYSSIYFEPYTGKNPAPSLAYPTDITGIEGNPVLFDFGKLYMQIMPQESPDYENLDKIQISTITSPLYGSYLGSMSTRNTSPKDFIAAIARSAFDNAIVCNNGLEDVIYYADKRDYKKGKDIRVFKTLTINPTEVSNYITDGGALGNGHKFILNINDNIKFENYSVTDFNEKEEKLLVVYPVDGFVQNIDEWHQKIWCNYLQSADVGFMESISTDQVTSSYDTIYYDIYGSVSDMNITVSLSNIAIYTTRASTVEEFAAFITTPMQIVYALDEPIETDIPEDELLNLNNIHIKNNTLYFITTKDINEETIMSEDIGIVNFDITYYRVPSSNGDIYPIESLNTLELTNTELMSTCYNISSEVEDIKNKLTIGSRVIFIGDSTFQRYDNYSFVDMFDINGDFTSVTKAVAGGATLGPYQIVPEAAGQSCLEQIQTYNSIIAGADMCFLQFCVNDVKCLVSKNVQIGTPSDASTLTTVCGYLKKCIETIYSYNSSISIIFLNLATNDSVIDMVWDNEVDSDAEKYKFYHKVWNLNIAAVLEQYNIPMINILDWTGINTNNFSNYTVHTEDGIHLNTAGNTLAYYRIKNALWNESEKSYPEQPKNLIIDATLGGNIGVENIEKIKNAFDNNIQVFFNLKENEDSTEDLIVPVNYGTDDGYNSYFTITQNDKLYLYELWTNTVGQTTYSSYNITDMKTNIDTALAAGAEKLETLGSFSGETYTIDSMKPNTLYNLRNVDLPTITVTAFEAPSNTNYVYTYHMLFQSNLTPVVLNLPSSVIYPDDFEIETKRIYEINILDNLLSYQSWPME